MSQHQLVLILDFGSQFTQLIARRLREEGVYCEIQPCNAKPPASRPDSLIGLILSGGPDSVLSDTAPPFDVAWLALGVPVLGVCYGMQLLAHLDGGVLGQGQAREYGRAVLERVGEESALLAAWRLGVPVPQRLSVIAGGNSGGDEGYSILLLYYSLQLRDREIASLLGLSRSKIQKDRKILFDELKKRMVE